MAVNVGTAYLEIIPSAKGFTNKLQGDVGGSMAKAGKDAGEKTTKGFGVGIKSLLGVTAGLAVSSGLVSFFKDANAEARESQKVGAITANVIKSTGGAANVTAKQVGTLSTAISNKTGIDDEAIQSASNLLLTFTNLRNETGKGNDVFNQATQAATDMGAALGTEPKAAAIQLGKALNDPVKGISALSRVGVSFTAQQKKQIGTMVKSGDTLGAQKVILGELNKEFGGTAAASSTASEKMSGAFGNFKEQIGTALMPVIDKIENTITTKVLPAISGFVTGMTDGTGAGGRFADHLKSVGNVLKTVGTFLIQNRDVIIPLVAAFATGVAVFKAVTAVVRVFTAVQTALNVVMSMNPISIVVLAIAALIAIVVIAYKRSATFHAIVDGAFRAIGAAGKWMWENALKPAFSALVAGVKALGAIGKWLWNNVYQPVFKLIIQGVVALLSMWAKMLRGLSHVPGFGWAKGAADAMDNAAGKARDLADHINKIPDHKNVTVRYNEVTIKSVINKQANDPRLAGARAGGGSVAGGRTYLVGEHGPELFTAPTTGHITPHAKTMDLVAGKGGNTFNIYETTSPSATARESARQLAWAGAN